MVHGTKINAGQQVDRLLAAGRDQQFVGGDLKLIFTLQIRTEELPQLLVSLDRGVSAKQLGIAVEYLLHVV
ncbi:hypothetical protein D3C81_1599650 [compost metagenome]